MKSLSMKNTLLWYVRQCSSLEIYQGLQKNVVSSR